MIIQNSLEHNQMDYGMFGEGIGMPQIPQGLDPKQLLRNMTDQQLLELVKKSPELSKEYDKIVKQQIGRGSTKTKPLTSDEYKKLKGKIDDLLDPEGGVIIEPTPGIVIKGFEQQSGEKVFINVVQHLIVDAPEEKLLVDYENQPGLRIPMSLGKVKEDHDKKGSICKVVDAAMNPQVIEAVKKDPGMMQFLAEILISYIFEKHKIRLTDKFNVMKEMNYKGTSVEFHRVKGKKAPKIEQVKEENFPISEEQKSKEEELFEMLSNPKQNKLVRPDFKVYINKSKTAEYDLEYQNLNELFIEFELPLLIHSRGIHLQVNQELIYLFVKGIYEIYIKLPIPVGKFKAKFVRNRRMLQIEMERKAVQEVPNTPASSASVPAKVKIQSDLLYDLV